MINVNNANAMAEVIYYLRSKRYYRNDMLQLLVCHWTTKRTIFKKIFINHFEYKIIHKIKIFYRKDLYERINRGREKELFRMVRR